MLAMNVFLSRPSRSDWHKITDRAYLRSSLQLRHPNIVKLHQTFDTPKTFYMILEVMTGGELFDRIVEKSKYSESEAAETMTKITDAIAYCHGLGIVHRDLKVSAQHSACWSPS
jgi:serine/threonine protein kinase